MIKGRYMVIVTVPGPDHGLVFWFNYLHEASSCYAEECKKHSADRVHMLMYTNNGWRDLA